MAAVPNPDKTGEIRSASAGSGQHALTSNTSIVIGGASGDLAKKKASRAHTRLYTGTLDSGAHCLGSAGATHWPRVDPSSHDAASGGRRLRPHARR